MSVIKIGLIENEEVYAEEIIEYIRRWEKENDLNEKCEINIFKSGEKFLLGDVNAYSVIFMDIGLDGVLDGMDVARRLRKCGWTQMIFFLTIYDNYVFDGYDVDASGYLMKPVEYGKIEKCMDKVFQHTRDLYFEHACKGKRCLIPYDDILYFQSSLHYIEIKTGDHTYRQKGSLSSLEKRLPPQFVRCHRFNIVNIKKAVQLTRKELKLTNGEILVISNTFRDAVGRAMFHELF